MASKHNSEDMIQAEIEKVVLGGDGLARLDSGAVLFVPFTLPGEVIKAKPVSIKRNLIRGEIVEIIAKSTERVEAKCPYFGKCGGCQYQHVKYEAQCKMKEEQVAETMTRIGKLPEDECKKLVKTISPSLKEWGYRNRISLHKGDGSFGYFTTDNKTIIQIKECSIANERINSELGRMVDMEAELGQKELVIMGFGPEWTDILKNETRVSILDKVFVFGQKCFIQANIAVFEDVMRYALSEEMLERGRTLLELYCGIGIISILAANTFERVYAADINSDSIGYARKNAERHNMKNIHFSTADAVEAIAGHMKQGIRPDTIILDPPREGLSKELTESLRTLKVQNLIYISCDPATFARDAARLSDSYELVSVKPFDMFPQTAHIEVVGRLRGKP